MGGEICLLCGGAFELGTVRCLSHEGTKYPLPENLQKKILLFRTGQKVAVFEILNQNSYKTVCPLFCIVEDTVYA